MLKKFRTYINTREASIKGDFVWYFIPTIVSLISGLVTFSILTKNLAAHEYGQLDFLKTVLGFLGMFLGLGVGVPLQQAIYTEKLGQFKSRDVVHTIFIFRNIISMLALGIGLFIYLFFHDFHYISALFIFFSVFATSMETIPREFLRRDRKPHIYTLIRVVYFISKPLALLVLVSFFLISFKIVLIIEIILKILVALLFFIIYFKYKGGKFQWCILGMVLKIGIPTLPANISNWIIKASDRFFIKMLKNNTQLGIYSAGLQLEIYLQMILLSLHNTMYPLFNHHLYHDNQQFVNKLLRDVSLIFVFLLITMSSFMKEFLLFFSKPDYYEGNVLFLIIPNYMFFIMLEHLYKSHMIISGKIRLIGLIRGSGALVNIFLNYFLVNLYSYHGAAIATFFAHLLNIIFTFFILKNFYSIFVKHHLFNMIILNFVLILNLFIITSPERSIVPQEIILKLATISLLAVFVYKKTTINKDFIKKILNK